MQSRQVHISRRFVAAVVSLALLLVPVLASGQGARRARPIARKVLVPESLRGQLPTPDDCREGVREIARGYGPERIREILHERFPNRFEMIDALSRLAVDASSIRLDIESVENVRIEPFKVVTRQSESGAKRKVVITDCVADVRSRLSIDGVSTGARRVLGVERAEWRIRFDPDETVASVPVETAPDDEGIGAPPIPPGMAAHHGRVLVRLEWPIPAGDDVMEKAVLDESRSRYAELVDRDGAKSVVYPDRPAAGWWIEVGEQVVMTDTEGHFTVPLAKDPPKEGTISRPGEGMAIARFQTSHLTPAGAPHADPIIIVLEFRGPCGMTPSAESTHCAEDGE